MSMSFDNVNNVCKGDLSQLLSHKITEGVSIQDVLVGCRAVEFFISMNNKNKQTLPRFESLHL